MLSQTFVIPTMSFLHSSWGASKGRNSLWPSQFPAVATEAQRAESCWPRALRAQGRQVLHRAQGTPGRSCTEHGWHQAGPAVEDPHTQAGPMSSTCAAAQSTEHREVQATVLLVTHYSGEIKLRNITMTEKVLMLWTLCSHRVLKTSVSVSKL